METRWSKPRVRNVPVPCFRCGSKDVYLKVHSDVKYGKSYYQVVCRGCGFEGPPVIEDVCCTASESVLARIEAVEKWNKLSQSKARRRR